MKGALLVVEDEPEARDLLGRALQREGWSIASAGDVRSALDLVESGAAFDAAVVDIVLGDDEEGGLRVLDALVPRGVPVVLVTAFADLRRVTRALNVGASYLLEKPFRVAELSEVLARVLSERDDLSARVGRALERASLTPKEASVARLLLKGLPTSEIARLEGNSDKTVRQHVSQIYAKCGVATRAEFFHFVFPT